MSNIVAFDGNEAVAFAMKQINPDVVAAYPITPQTEIVQTFSQYVADGVVDTEFVPVESEHAAMSACIGAAVAGARAMTATCGAGLALMWEMLWCASGMRLPIVMIVVNRSLSAPLNILTDQTDMMGVRDAGWIQIYAENHQEVYDNVIQAVRIAEHPEVMLPVICGHAGFTLGHTLGRLEVLPDEDVKRFVGEPKPIYSILDVKSPKTFGACAHSDYFFEFRRQQWDGMEKALKVIPEVGEEFGRLTGRRYELVEEYRCEDADIICVIMGSAAGALREAIDYARERGVGVGMLKIRCFRPFPGDRVFDVLKRGKGVVVFDRVSAFGGDVSPLCADVCSSLYTRGEKNALIYGYIYGLGGRDTVPEEFIKVFDEVLSALKEGESFRMKFLGLRE